MNTLPIHSNRAARSALLVVYALVSFAAGASLVPSACAQAHYVEAWGWNGEGECNVPAGLSNAVAVSGGGDFSVALRSDGTVIAWGNNDIGQSSVPAGLSNVVAISASMQRFALALKSDGTVVGWGNNGQGQLNIPAGLSNVIAIAAGEEHCLALKNDGTVVAWGVSSCGQSISPPAGLSNVVAISADQNSMALKSDGTVVQWDCQEYSVPSGLPALVAIATRQHTLGLAADGTLSAWGLNDNGAATVPAGISNLTAIAVGFDHDLVLLGDGTVAAWGFNRDGEGSVPPGLASVTGISAGGDHNLVVTTIPLIHITAQPQSVVTNLGTTASFQVAANCQVSFGYHWQKNGSTLPSATNSTLTIPNAQSSDAASYTVILSYPSFSVTSSVAVLSFVPLPIPVIVSQPKNGIVPLGSPASFSVAATSSLPLSYQWEKNGGVLAGQTATNFTIASTVLTDEANYSVIVSNSSGSVTSRAANLSFASSSFATTTPSTVISLGGPAVPSSLDDAIAIAAGYGQQLAIHSNGTVVAWGNALDPIPGPPSDLSNAVSVASGGVINIALKSDGTVEAWGHSATPPAGLSGVVSVAAGNDCVMALKSDGTAVMWGPHPIPPPYLSGVSNCVGITIADDFGNELLSDGTVPANSQMPLGLFGYGGTSNVVAIAGSEPSDLTLLQNDGTVTAAGFSVAPGINNIVAISPGFGLTANGSVVNLGTGVIIPGLTNVLAISGSPGNGLILSHWPAILAQPQNLNANANTSATLSVTAAGAPPLTYQWRRSGTNIDTATASGLTLASVQLSDAGTYDVLVGNGAGAIASLPATLTVNGSPGVITPPPSATLYVGMHIDLTVAASGAQPLGYQWQHNGSAVAGATTTILSLNNVQLTDAGSYAVILTNSYNSITSAPGVLTVISNSFHLPAPGTVVGLGGPPVPAGLTNAIAISVGYGQEMAALSDGTVVIWGQPTDPIPGPPAELSNVIAVAAGGVLDIALKSDGTVVGWGHSATPPTNLFGVVAIAAGMDSAMALRADGTAVMWGPVTQFGPSSTVSNYTGITIANDFAVEILSGGTVPANPNLLGSQSFFPGASNVTAIAGSGFSSLTLLHSDGTVSGFNLTIPPGVSNIVAISPGLALRDDGTVIGLNASAPPGLTNVTAVAGWVGKGLVLTTNPPPPILAGGGSAGGNFIVNIPLSVPGYVLLSSDSPTGPFTPVPNFTNSVTDTNGFTVPITGSKQYYRLLKQ